MLWHSRPHQITHGCSAQIVYSQTAIAQATPASAFAFGVCHDLVALSAHHMPDAQRYTKTTPCAAKVVHRSCIWLASEQQIIRLLSTSALGKQSANRRSHRHFAPLLVS